MQIHNSPSFGMSYKLNKNSLFMLSDDDLSKLGNLVVKNEVRLDKASQGADVTISGALKTLNISAVPENATKKELLLQTLNYLNPFKKNSFIKKIKLADLNQDSFLNAVKEVTNAVARKKV